MVDLFFQGGLERQRSRGNAPGTRTEKDSLVAGGGLLGVLGADRVAQAGQFLDIGDALGHVWLPPLPLSPFPLPPYSPPLSRPPSTVDSRY